MLEKRKMLEAIENIKLKICQYLTWFILSFDNENLCYSIIE